MFQIMNICMEHKMRQVAISSIRQGTKKQVSRDREFIDLHRKISCFCFLLKLKVKVRFLIIAQSMAIMTYIRSQPPFTTSITNFLYRLRIYTILCQGMIRKMIQLFIYLNAMINEKGVFGMISGLITTVLLQPFENIKMALMIPPLELKEQHLRNNFIHNTKSSCKYIYNSGGIKGFYKGMLAATLKAALGCYIYFTGLRAFQERDRDARKNFMVSSLSRITSTFLTNPLSIIETRFELAYFHGYDSIHAAIVDIYKKEGLRGFFSGGLSSCIKEGTFGGFHYMFYEELKTQGNNKFISGILSGMTATIVTHPFEIIRAKLQTRGLYEQVNASEHLILSELKKMMARGGWTKGMLPRLIKKPIANTLTFLMFQIMQQAKE